METGATPTRPHSMKCPKLYGEECKCDNYHTFDELYEHRVQLYLALMRHQATINEEWGSEGREIWKSKLHSDGTMFHGWFIAGIRKDKGEQITYHLPLKCWDECFATELEHAPEWDGHTSDDVIDRLKHL